MNCTSCGKVPNYVMLLLLLITLLCSTLIIPVNASGESKTANYYIGDFGPTLCEISVHFSWDTSNWKLGEEQQVSFTLRAENIDPNVESLTLNVQEIIVRLNTDKITGFSDTYDILHEYTSNQVTDLVWRQGYSNIMNTPRSFSYEVKVPEEFSKLSADTSVELYYLIKLGGSFNYVQVGGINLHGGGAIDEYISNEGTMSGGIEDPAWITVKAQSPYWLYIVITIVGIGIASGASALFIVKKKHKSNWEKMPPPPPPTQSVD